MQVTPGPNVTPHTADTAVARPVTLPSRATAVSAVSDASDDWSERYAPHG